MLVQTTSELEHQVTEISVLMENSQFTMSAMSYAKNPNRPPQVSDKGQRSWAAAGTVRRAMAGADLPHPSVQREGL